MLDSYINVITLGRPWTVTEKGPHWDETTLGLSLGTIFTSNFGHVSKSLRGGFLSTLYSLLSAPSKAHVFNLKENMFLVMLK
jgi:hypothetical protein